MGRDTLRQGCCPRASAGCRGPAGGTAGGSAAGGAAGVAGSEGAGAGAGGWDPGPGFLRGRPRRRPSALYTTPGIGPERPFQAAPGAGSTGVRTPSGVMYHAKLESDWDLIAAPVPQAGSGTAGGAGGRFRRSGISTGVMMFVGTASLALAAATGVPPLRVKAERSLLQRLCKTLTRVGKPVRAVGASRSPARGAGPTSGALAASALSEAGAAAVIEERLSQAGHGADGRGGTGSRDALASATSSCSVEPDSAERKARLGVESSGTVSLLFSCAPRSPARLHSGALDTLFVCRFDAQGLSV